ncbi:hypothetical protein HC928_00580 [bacterium]|nr:hypothetical protein [bacterium]
MPNIRPKYQVEPYDGEYEVTTIRYKAIKMEGRDKPVYRREQAVEKRRGGFMVYTARGESVHVRNEASLRGYGIDPNVTPAVIDMDSGEEVTPPVASLKRLATQRTARNDARASNGG